MKSLYPIGLLMLSSIGQATTLTVVKDVSGSAPLLTNVKFAKSAAYAAASKLKTYKAGDTLKIRTLGETGLKNIGSTSQTIKRHKKKQLSRLYQSIKTIPEQKIQGQSETNILYFLTYTGFDCAGGEEIFMISDGIESSSEVDAKKLIAGNALPPPRKDMLKGCKLTLYGLGLADPPLPNKNVNNILTAWKNWSKIAGLDLKIVVNP